MQGGEQVAEADLLAQPVADLAPADFRTAVRFQERAVDFDHGLALSSSSMTRLAACVKNPDRV